MPEPVISRDDGSIIYRSYLVHGAAENCTYCGVTGCAYRYTLVGAEDTTRLGACCSLRCAERCARRIEVMP